MNGTQARERLAGAGYVVGRERMGQLVSVEFNGRLSGSTSATQCLSSATHATPVICCSSRLPPQLKAKCQHCGMLHIRKG